MDTNIKEIPKVIHFCWFGRNSFPELAEKCIKSWEKHCPDYEIKLWSEDNFDVNCCEYVKKAYENKKWAFVSDYARFWILYNYGGIYFDTDVEVVKEINTIVERGSFFGTEFDDKFIYENNRPIYYPINAGLGMAALPKMNVYKEILEYYNSAVFDPSCPKTVVHIVTDIFVKKGYKDSGKIENIEDVIIYPSEYLGSKNKYTGKISVSDNTVSIHHYTASWQEPKTKIKIKLQRLLGEKNTNKIIALKKSILNIKK